MFGFNWRNKKAEEESQEEVNSQFTVNAATMTNASAAAESAVQNSDLGVTRQYDRKLYDSKKAKADFHDSQFGDKKTITGPNGETLHRSHKAAKNKYGDKQWAAHAAEADHVDPLKNIHTRHKKDAFLSDTDIKEIGNRQSNFQELSKRENASKGAGDVSFSLQKLGTEARLGGRKAKNIAKLGHTESVQAAKETGLLVLGTAGVANMVAAIKGEKSGKEAVADTAKTSGKAAMSQYVRTKGLATVTKPLTNSSSKFLKSLGENHVPAKVVTGVMLTGQTLKQFHDGEINGRQCILALGKSGLGFAASGYGSVIGLAICPIGGIIGAFVGTALSDALCDKIIGKLEEEELAHQERIRLIEEYKLAAEQARVYRLELEEYLAHYFEDYQNCFDEALAQLEVSFQRGDVDGMIQGANMVTRKLGGKIRYDNMTQFKDYLADDMTDYL